MAGSSFVNPGKEYRPAPFWSWNGTMRPDEVKRQIGLMHEQGFGGYFMHSRIGLETPYMSEEWMQAIEAGLDGAVEHDMEAWFYDEDKWPSGFAGGIVPALGPEYRVKGLEAHLLDAASIEQAWNNPGPDVPEGALRALFALQMDGNRLVGFTRLPAPPEAGAAGSYLFCQMHVAMPGQEWYNGQSYVDLMDRKVTDAFIKCTHEAYKERFGNRFGPHAPGIFTDEPNVAPTRGNVQTPWTTTFPQRFQELWGYDIVDRLPLLYLAGEGSAQVRHDYWATVTIMFRDNFSRPFGAWCEENGIAMTGHYLCEDNLVNQITHVGAVMPHYPSQQLPGIDHLGRNINDPLTLKQVSSVAHQMGRKRVLCEIFGVAGHSMSFADQKWIADFHFALGITFLNPHLTLYSMLGERKRDYPANISWAQPYWPEYRTFNDYAARCSWFTQRGNYQADILLLHPVGTAWSLVPGRCSGSNYDEQIQQAQELNRNFLSVFDTLLANHYDFDLGDELIMADSAAVDGQKLGVGEMRYKTVILPYCSILAPQTADLLRRFIVAGGQVLAVGSQPQSTIDGITALASAQELPQALRNVLPRDISITGDDGLEVATVRYQHRQDGERQLYFLANNNLHDGFTAQIRVPASGDVTVFDLTSGASVTLQLGESSPFSYAAVKVLNNDSSGLTLEWQAPPAGSLAFSVGAGADPEAGLNSDSRAANYHGFPGAVTEPTHTINGPWAFERLQPNVLTLDYCRAAIGGGELSDEFQPVPAVRAAVMQACGRQTMTQPYIYLTGQLPSQAVPVQMEFQFLVHEMPAKLALVVEQPEKLDIRVNGQPAAQAAFNAEGVNLAYAWLHDPGFGALDIVPLVHTGVNTISLSFTAAADGADVEEVYLLGDFGVWAQNGVFALGKEPETLAPGNWVGQGYPFYSGVMRYKLSLDGATKWLDLSAASASLLRVHVNGRTIHLPWRPWVVHIQPYLHPGENTVLVDVISTLRNAFGPLHHKMRDALGWVGPGEFTVSPRHWTDEYHFAPYGLLEPVKVV